MPEPPRTSLETYDRYWSTRNTERAASRSRERARAAVELLESVGAAAGRLLDVGCGPGWALEVFSREGLAATGIDVSPGAVDAARQRGLKVHQADVVSAGSAEILEALGGPFDVVTALELLEHVEDPLSVLCKLRDLVATGGRLVISLPNEIHLAARTQVLLGRLPFGGHDDPHVRHFDLRRGAALVEAAGLRPARRRFISLVPPRHPILRRLTAPLLPVLPGLLAISTVLVLEGTYDGRD